MKVSLLPEFVFKETGERPPRVDVPDRTHYQWANSYSLITYSPLLQTIQTDSVVQSRWVCNLCS